MRTDHHRNSMPAAVAAAGRAVALAATLSLGACAQMSDLGLGGAKEPESKVAAAPASELEKATAYKAAIPYFERAREMAPAQSSILNNLAMAYTMDGQADRAEGLLRQAAQINGSDARVKQNLAMVLGLQGKRSEAKEVAGVADGDDAEPAPPIPESAAKAAPAAIARAPLTAPVTAVAATPLDPDEVIKQALKAEAAKTKAAEAAARKPAKQAKPAVVADAAGTDAPPALKPAAP